MGGGGYLGDEEKMNDQHRADTKTMYASTTSRTFCCQRDSPGSAVVTALSLDDTQVRGSPSSGDQFAKATWSSCIVGSVLM